MLHPKYKGSSPCGFRQEDFFMFFPIHVYAFVKHVTPRTDLFLAPGAKFEQTWLRSTR